MIAPDLTELAVTAAAAVESPDERASRYERALTAIRDCPLEGLDFGDYVQSLTNDVLNGDEAECWNCGTAVHEGECVDPEADTDAPAA